jgi:hypothetical protein
LKRFFAGRSGATDKKNRDNRRKKIKNWPIKISCPHYLDKKWTIHEEQAGVVRKIFNDYVADMKQKDIAEGLNAKGLRTNRGKPFSVNILSQLLRNERYTGILRTENEIYTDIIPAIIDEKIYLDTQRKLDANKYRGALNKAKISYDLSGKLYCRCGSLMTGDMGTGQTGAIYHYYKCFNKKKTKKCTKKSVKKDEIEQYAVDTTIKTLIQNPAILKSIAENMVQIFNQDMQDTSILNNLMSQINDREKAINNLLKALEMGIFSHTTKDRLDQLEREKSDIETEVLLQTIFAAKPLEFDTVYSFFKSFKDLDYSVPENRSRLIKLFIRKIILSDDKPPKIYYNASFDQNDIKETTESETKFGFGGSGSPSRI